ncbi:MAG: sigma-70 family RNA polymerase sigma factor [Planctomycetes bacterium]|nr:sigma-70 family RNA polymerase sigma factor [Planctomycetota bacterium]MCB9887003.1 sigma-70 family RNA polymerase sigma factor [Planctomycetota bacterium]
MQPAAAAQEPGVAPTLPGAGTQARLRRYLRFLGADRQVLDDLVQEALLAGVKTFGNEPAALPWLLVAARNALRQHLRRLGRRREVADLDRLDRVFHDQVGDDGGDAQRAALRRCLDELPPRSRQALELRYGEGASRAVIAAALGLGEEGAKTLLARLRKALGACIERRLADD